MCCWVSALTRKLVASLSACETVVTETPAAFATSRIPTLVAIDSSFAKRFVLRVTHSTQNVLQMSTAWCAAVTPRLASPQPSEPATNSTTVLSGVNRRHSVALAHRNANTPGGPGYVNSEQRSWRHPRHRGTTCGREKSVRESSTDERISAPEGAAVEVEETEAEETEAEKIDSATADSAAEPADI